MHQPDPQDCHSHIRRQVGQEKERAVKIGPLELAIEQHRKEQSAEEKQGHRDKGIVGRPAQRGPNQFVLEQGASIILYSDKLPPALFFLYKFN